MILLEIGLTQTVPARQWNAAWGGSAYALGNAIFELSQAHTSFLMPVSNSPTYEFDLPAVIAGSNRFSSSPMNSAAMDAVTMEINV